jgi:class 3 adenylate cyclase
LSSETDSDAASPALERRLATILSADVAGYSRMMGVNEEATVQTLRGHRAVFDAMLKQHRGRVFNTAGDAILAEFPSAVDAVRCATEIQTALQTRNEHLPPELKMQFRMGINLGDVVVQDGDLLGDGVNVAARIQTVAEPGGVCISGSVYDQIQNKLSLQFRTLGEQQFKNIGQPIRTFTITHGERGALPVGTRRLPPKTVAITLASVAAIAIIAGAIALYHFTETTRSEQDALSAKMAAEKAAVEEARRAAEAESRRAMEAEMRAERERSAAEAARRETALQMQLQSAEEARRRAEADRKRIDDERQRAEADRRRLDDERQRAGSERRAAEGRAAETARAEADKKVATTAPTGAAQGSRSEPPAAIAAAGGTSKFDGSYRGSMCNFPNNPERRLCFNSTFRVENGAVDWNWLSRVTGKRASARLTIGADASVAIAMNGWSINDGSALAGTMRGRASDNGIDAQGRWANGAPIEGHWTRAP